jgi:two-component system nitrogen regulation response regulator NtrX
MTAGDVIDAQDIPPLMGEYPRADHLETMLPSSGSLKEARRHFEKRYILKKLAEHEWNIAKTADAIGVERSNLHKKVRQFGIIGIKGE